MASDCPVCDGDHAITCGLSNDSFSWLHCPDCDHLFQYPPTMTAKYNAQYVADRYDKYDTTAAMSWLRLGLVKSVCGGGKLLDVGYGNGAFIKVATQGGFDAYGCDVHGCGEKYGVREKTILGESWDVVTFFDSLEHFASLEDIKKMRARNVVVSVPYRAADTMPSIDWKHLRPGEHLQAPSPVSLVHLMQHVAPFKYKFIDLEDSIRGHLNGDMNILTMVFYL